MSMKKAFDQTLRDLKRGVNKKVLKVPYIEQKVLDATSNEAWGPHGTLLADIALATRNYHEYQMIMSIIWKRINDTGKNWRHVYKALTVLEYLVANGSERVIDEIKEHAYQISTLSDFQYIDSSGKDQGLNVRRKSQSLVSLVNDKERIQEVRQKAAANRDKFQSTSAVGGMHRPHSYSGGYGDRFDDGRYEGRYGGRDDDRVGYGRDREWGYRDDDRRGQYGDPYSRDDDRYRDDDYRGKNDEYGSRSSDREKERAYDDDDDRHSSRGSSVKTEDHLQEGRRVEQKSSEQNCGAPPSYEEAVNGSKSPHYEREGETPVAKASSPTANTGPCLATADLSSSSCQVKEAAEIDEFDPRGSVSAGPAQSNNAEVDLLGSLSEELSLAITTVSSELPSAAVPAPGTSFPESHFMATNSAPTSVYQSFEDPFGDTPFKATPPDEATIQTQNFAAAASLPSAFQAEQAPPNSQKVATGGNLEFANTFDGLSFSADNGHTLPSSNSQPTLQEPNQSSLNDDILAGILPPTGSEAPYSAPTTQPLMQSYNNVPNFTPQAGPHAGAVSPIVSQNLGRPTAQYNNDMNSLPQSTPGFTSNLAPSGAVSQQSNDDFLGGLLQAGSNRNSPSQISASVASTGSLALVPQAPPPKEKFEPKSAVWADTLSRGLVNLNISGPKVNPNADIGIDFETLNRKEKRMEKPTATPITSTVTMGKAMGSGSGMGRAGGTGFRPPSNHMMGPHMGMGMGMGMNGGMGMAGGQGMGMVGYGSVNQPVGMGMGMMGGNMNMGMGRGVPMQPINGLAPAMNVSNAYNPMMGRGGGNYGPQHPYGSGYQ